MNTLDRFVNTFVSRRDDYALQRSDGGYVRVGRPLALRDVYSHLTGAHALGSYVIDEQGQCRFAVFDADSEDGLEVLHRVQDQLHAAGIPSVILQEKFRSAQQAVLESGAYQGKRNKSKGCSSGPYRLKQGTSCRMSGSHNVCGK
jgi:hypothetical protein